MSLPVVTVCIPTFNNAQTLGNTLDSILLQNYQPIKVKIFDNQSTDESVSVARKYQEKFLANPQREFDIIVNEKNIGAEGNFTLALNSGEGEYTAILHSDDIYDSNFLTIAVQSLEEHKDSSAFCCQSYVIDEKGVRNGARFVPREIRAGQLKVINFQSFVELVFKYGNFVTCPSVVARTSLYKNQIKIWNGKDFKTSADLDVWLRLTQLGSLLFFNKPLMSYRVSLASYSHRITKKRIERHDLFLVLDQWLDRVKSENKDNIFSKKLEYWYRFLIFKDEALRIYNAIKGNEKVMPHFSVSFLESTRYLWSSYFHFKYWLLGNGIRVYRYFAGRI